MVTMKIREFTLVKIDEPINGRIRVRLFELSLSDIEKVIACWECYTPREAQAQLDTIAKVYNVPQKNWKTIEN